MRTEEEIRREIARSVELETMGRISQSGFGPGSDICERVWATMAEHGIHSDGKIRIDEYVRRLCVMAHYARGAKIQFKLPSGEWVSAPKPSWDFNECDFRVKP